MQGISILVYSKDRAFQLDGCLQSFFCFSVNGDFEIFVLYKATSEKSQSQYEVLKGRYPSVNFVEEKLNLLLTQTLELSKLNKLTMFLVDDTLFYSEFDLELATSQLLAIQVALGFSLRLGLNTDYCYMSNCEVKVPTMEHVFANVHMYDWTKESHDFGYPFEVSSSIYLSSVVESALGGIASQNLCPSLIESRFNSQKRKFSSSQPKLLCFDKSVAFSAPVNLTKAKGSNPHGKRYPVSIATLSNLFDEGKRIDVGQNANLKVIGAHQEVEYKYL